MGEFLTEVPGDKWVKLVPELRLPQLDHLEKDSVTIQCINSSDFVIGKQTNFNGPVTIISCSEVLKQGCHNRNKSGDEKIVIEDKVLSRSAANMVQKIAAGKGKPSDLESSDQQEKRGVLRTLNVCLKIVLPSVIFVITVAVALVLFFTPATEDLNSDCTPLPRNACIYPLSSWNGSVTSGKKQLKTPVPYIVISQTRAEEFCYSVDECLQMIDVFYSNQTRLSCNFFLGWDGNAYEGRGWKWENSLEGPVAGKSLQICFLGGYLDVYPTFPQSETAKNLIQYAVDKNYLAKDYVLVACNATSSDEYLGPFLYTVIKKWDHFVEKPFS